MKNVQLVMLSPDGPLVQRITSSFRALRFSIGLRPRIVYEHICGILYLDKLVLYGEAGGGTPRIDIDLAVD